MQGLTWLARIAAAASSSLSLAASAGAQYPAVTIPNTELRSFHSTITGRDYDLYVYPPTAGSLAPVASIRCSTSLTAVGLQTPLARSRAACCYEKYVPDVIVVGITYSGAKANYDSLRAVDYTPRARRATPARARAPSFSPRSKTRSCHSSRRTILPILAARADGQLPRRTVHALRDVHRAVALLGLCRVESRRDVRVARILRR